MDPWPHFRGFLITHIQRRTVGLLWTSDQPVTGASTYTRQHNRQTSMSRVGFEPATPVTKWPQTYALDRAATGIGIIFTLFIIKTVSPNKHGS
jgi:hypothetical protein